MKGKQLAAGVLVAIGIGVAVWIGLDRVSWSIRWRSADAHYLTALSAFSTAMTAVASAVAGAGVLIYVVLTHRLWRESRRTNQQARRAGEAALMTQMMIEYDSRRDDVETIRAFYRQYPKKDAALKAFRDLKQHGDGTSQIEQRVDPARFRLSRFFVRIRKLSKAGFLSRRIVWLALQRAAIEETFLEQVDPLDQEIAQLNHRPESLADRQFFRELVNDRGKAKGGRVGAPTVS